MAEKPDAQKEPARPRKPRQSKPEALKRCGLVMPISPIGPYTALHWDQVKEILEQSAETAGFLLELVSDARDVGVIHKRIIQNLFERDMVVCDVSGRNPNVMFELGVRFAFDKATVIVKDDRTDFSFDVQHIEHVLYPADLNFHGVVDFKKRLAEKIDETFKASMQPSYSPFLESYHKLVPGVLKTIEVGVNQFLLDELKGLSQQISSLPIRNVRNQNFGTLTTGVFSHLLTAEDEKAIRATVARSLKPVSKTDRFTISIAELHDLTNGLIREYGISGTEQKYPLVYELIRDEVAAHFGVMSATRKNSPDLTVGP